MSKYDILVTELLEKDCWVIDYLPRQVPANSPGQFFNVENYLLNHYEEFDLRKRFTAVVLKLLCYHKLTVHWGQWVEDPSPALLAEAIQTILENHVQPSRVVLQTILENHSGWLNMLLPEEQALLVFEWDCLNLALYDPSPELLGLMEEIARSEGLFLWKSDI